MDTPSMRLLHHNFRSVCIWITYISLNIHCDCIICGAFFFICFGLSVILYVRLIQHHKPYRSANWKSWRILGQQTQRSVRSIIVIFMWFIFSAFCLFTSQPFKYNLLTLMMNRWYMRSRPRWHSLYIGQLRLHKHYQNYYSSS